MEALPTNPTEITYDCFAGLYDAFTHNHDYDSWLPALEELAGAHGLTGKRVLDLACGTGKSFVPLLSRGYEVVGCDVSGEMLSIAARKAPGVRLVQSDIRALDRVGEFDLVTCLCDSLNYMLDADSLLAAFAAARRNLAPGGLLFFDVNTVEGYRRTWASTFCVEVDESYFVWNGLTPPDIAPGDPAAATIEAFTRTTADAWRRVTSRHHQRHHPQPLVRSLLARAGLSCLGVYGQLTDGSVEPSGSELDHHKLVYVTTPLRR
jgi:SAM-dependent methyltransferase